MMESTFNSPSATAPMLSMSHSFISEGSFMQHNEQIHMHDNRRFHIQGGAKGGFEYLKEAVAPSAFHNSGERFDPPKCHPSTRVAVVKKIMDWILGQDPETRNALIMWLHGSAGAGKSAIAQSIAELCYSEGRLLASFFFGRSDPTRNHARSLIPTIAYQIWSAIPAVRGLITTAVEDDPLIFTRSLIAQLMALIVEPLRNLFQSCYFSDPNVPRLILIDGLDECLDRHDQRNILDTILKAIRELHVPFIFLVVSRPEHDISTVFNSHKMDGILNRLLLDHSYSPGRDIELFLRDKFNEITAAHPFKQSTPTPWPTEDAIQILVYKSSGQFIYASTVVKYVESSRHRPHHRLEVILSPRASRGDSDLPFAELDALYTHILSSVDEIGQVLDVVAFFMLGVDRRIVLDDAEKVLSLAPGDIEILLRDLGSIISLSSSRGRTVFRILHASLSDFLLDQSWSKQFHINIALKCTEHLRKCFQFLAYAQLTNNRMEEAPRLAMDFILLACDKCLPSVELRNDILSFSITRIFEEGAAAPELIPYFNHHFLPKFFGLLKNSKFKDADDLYKHHLHSFDESLRHHLEIYYADMNLTLLVALVDFIHFKRHWPPYRVAITEFEEYFQLFDVDSTFFDIDQKHCSLVWGLHRDHLNLLFDFLEDPARSGQYALDGNKYATAALCCLNYLCNHRSSPQTMLSQLTKRAKHMRRITPWMWLRRIGRHSALDKTQMWLVIVKGFETPHGSWVGSLG